MSKYEIYLKIHGHKKERKMLGLYTGKTPSEAIRKAKSISERARKEIISSGQARSLPSYTMRAVKVKRE